MARHARNATERGTPSSYALGNTDAEHDRLIRQASYLAPVTEQLFREAGIGPGQRSQKCTGFESEE